jgi:ubiquinone/menaquinone biosynthesis C-methylase UbiE
MSEVSDRIAGLSEDKRRLLERLLQERRAATPNAQTPKTGFAAAAVAAKTETAPVTLVSPAQPASLNEVKAGFKRFYDVVNTQLDSSVFGAFSFFLNYGYVANLSPQHSKVELPDHFINKNSVRLVLELIGDCDLNQQRVLDVGCGRGGTIFVIKQFFNPQSVQGIDLSSNAIASCRKNHHYDNVRFDEGDAEHLPFNDEQFDIVTNVESSHSYPNINAFYAQVFRVLRPGGCFLYTDVMPVLDMPRYLAELKRIGFVLEVDRDITPNVLLSCDEVATTRVSAFDSGNDQQLMSNFLATPGSQVYEDMRSRRWSYRIFRFRKPAAPAEPATPPPTATLSQPKAECSRQYDEINQQLDASEFGAVSLFLNLGYVGDASESQSVVTLPEYCLNKNSAQLVLELVGPCDLENREVLDVGCGRGGAISVMKQYFKPRRICGIDIAPAAIRFCRSSQPEISFEVGDAEQLPFATESFDVVTNMESSSTYPDLFAFYREVFRVLRPGGDFLYTDALARERFSEGETYLRRIGFDLMSDRDITNNVLVSCDEIARQRLTAYGPAADQNLNDFLGAPGSHFYNEMKRGAWSYRIQRWTKRR